MAIRSDCVVMWFTMFCQGSLCYLTCLTQSSTRSTHTLLICSAPSSKCLAHAFVLFRGVAKGPLTAAVHTRQRHFPPESLYSCLLHFNNIDLLVAAGFCRCQNEVGAVALFHMSSGVLEWMTFLCKSDGIRWEVLTRFLGTRVVQVD